MREKGNSNPELTRYCTESAEKANNKIQLIIECIGGNLKSIYDDLGINPEIFADLTQSEISSPEKKSSKQDKSKITWTNFQEIEDFISQ